MRGPTSGGRTRWDSTPTNTAGEATPGGGRRLLGRVWGVGLFVLSFLGALLSQSRSGMIAWSVGIVGMGLFSPWRSRWRLLIPLAAVGIVTLTLRFGDTEWESYGVVDVIERRFETAFSGGHMVGTAGVRVDIWQRQLDWLTTGNFSTSELLFGVGGIDGSILTFRASSHSGFLGPLMYYGIPMGVLLQLALLALALQAVRLGLGSRNPGAVFMVAAMMAAMVGSEFLVSSMCVSVFGFLLAILARLSTMSTPAASSVKARRPGFVPPGRPVPSIPPGPGGTPGLSPGTEATRAAPP